jgi:hypothetical protein
MFTGQLQCSLIAALDCLDICGEVFRSTVDGSRLDTQLATLITAAPLMIDIRFLTGTAYVGFFLG